MAVGSRANTNNILLLIADDFGIDSCPVYSTNTGASLPPTPTIDALARSGLRFRNAYASPLCSPTRSCIITGRYAFRTGVGNVITRPADPKLTAGEWTLPEALANTPATTNYAMAQFGKWHLNPAANSPSTVGGWPHFSGSLDGAIEDYTNWTKTVNGSGTPNYSNYATSDVVDDAIAWISAQTNRPWFAWVAFNAPHTPLHKPPNNLHSYDSLSGTDTGINPRPYYEAMVEAMDTEIARLLASIATNQTDIIFIGDNGTPRNVIQPPYTKMPNHSKGTLYEGGTRVPMIFCGPAVAGTNRESDAIVHVVDLFATILALAGTSVDDAVPAGTAIDSRDLLPALRDETFSSDRAYVELFGDGLADSVQGQILRGERYKLLHFADGTETFHDLSTDENETNDLLAAELSPAQQEQYSCLTMRLATFRDDLTPPKVLALAYSGGHFLATVASQSGRSYSLWRSTNLLCTGWIRLTNAVITTGSTTVTIADPNPSDDNAFYRVLEGSP